MNEGESKELLKMFSEIKALEERAHKFYTSALPDIQDEKLKKIVGGIDLQEIKHIKIAGELMDIAVSLRKKEFTVPALYSEVFERLGKEVEDLSSPFSILIESSLESYSKVGFVLPAVFKLKGKKITYFCINKPGKKMKKIMEETVGNSEGVQFIDSFIVNENGMIVDPKNLAQLEIDIEKSIKKGGLIMLDSLSSLALYHEKGVVERFMHALTYKSKKMGFDLVAINLEEESKLDNYKTVYSFFDRVIKI